MSSSGSPAGAFSPFAHRAFALLWTATLVSNVGTWMHDVGAGWLMTTLNSSPAVVASVQAATTLPVFLFALLAGALADRLDKRHMLVVINLILAAIVSGLAFLVWREQVTPALLILFTFAVGTGAAFMAPAWQAVVPQLVPRDRLKPAIALNSMGINISRAIGPALAGVLIASVGLAAPFIINALSFIVIVGALLLWRPDPMPVRAPGRSLLGDMTTGLRHVAHNEPMRATLVRAGAFFLFASAYWALLPLIARGAEGGGSELYGTLMALIGAGAVAGALLLPRVQRHASSDIVAKGGTVGTAMALVTMALSASPPQLMVAAFLGGFSWIAVLTSLNVSAQTALPDWVRARGLAVFLMTFFGSMALGSVTWGQLASATTIPTALLIAAAALILAMLASSRLAIGGGEGLDLSPAAVWPMAPELLGPNSDGGRPAMVTVEYSVREEDRKAFLAALHRFSRERLRDGAYRWHVHQCVEVPELWVESFQLPSWREHLQQHDRITRHDADLQAELRRFDTREGGPVVRHYTAP